MNRKVVDQLVAQDAADDVSERPYPLGLNAVDPRWRVLPACRWQTSSPVAAVNGVARRLERSRLVVCGDVTERLSELGRGPAAGIHDGLGQDSVAGTHLDHVENGRVSQESPHLLQLSCDKHAENRMTHG